jgi:hypothetical protein
MQPLITQRFFKAFLMVVAAVSGEWHLVLAAASMRMYIQHAL